MFSFLLPTLDVEWQAGFELEKLSWVISETVVCQIHTFTLSYSPEDYVFFVSPALNSWPHPCSFYNSVNKYDLTHPPPQ